MKEETHGIISIFVFIIILLAYGGGMSVWNVYAWAGKATLPTIQTMPWWAYVSAMFLVGLLAWINFIPDITAEVPKKTKLKAMKYVPMHMLSSAGAIFGCAWGNSISIQSGINEFKSLGLTEFGPWSTALMFVISTTALTIFGYLIIFATAYMITELVRIIISYIRKIFTKNKVSESPIIE
jgi:hypothetical protein